MIVAKLMNCIFEDIDRIGLLCELADLTNDNKVGNSEPSQVFFTTIFSVG